MLVEEAVVCSKIGKVLYQAELYSEALDFFKVSNNFTMIYRCITAQSLTSYSQLIDTGRFFASILQFDRAKEMYQLAYDESDSEEKKHMAWSYVLEATR